MVKPAGLGEAPREIVPDDDPRLKLADWMADTSNPFFAKALVNRYWKHFFKRGLVEPEDDIRDTNPPTNPELLDALAAHFIQSGFDMKDLIREITRSQTYQLSSEPNEHNLVDVQNFSRFYPKRMQAEVLLDALDALPDRAPTSPICRRAPGRFRCRTTATIPRRSFSECSVGPNPRASVSANGCQSSSLSRSLHLMNSAEVKGKVAVAAGRGGSSLQTGGQGSRCDPRALPGRLRPPAFRRGTPHRDRIPHPAGQRRPRQTDRSRCAPNARPTRIWFGRCSTPRNFCATTETMTIRRFFSPSRHCLRSLR